MLNWTHFSKIVQQKASVIWYCKVPFWGIKTVLNMAFHWTATTIALNFVQHLKCFLIWFLFLYIAISGACLCSLFSPSVSDWPTLLPGFKLRGKIYAHKQTFGRLDAKFKLILNKKKKNLSLTEAPVCSISQKSEFLSDWWTTHPKWPAVHEVANCSMLQSVQGIFCALLNICIFNVL